mmetsp:Transcript_46103/g.76196  ORF Transcript_46103/g.76196 Transcript_46103/m.76196 type:complete len:326 (-) Transcript_46103:138-1115(-)
MFRFKEIMIGGHQLPQPSSSRSVLRSSWRSGASGCRYHVPGGDLQRILTARTAEQAQHRSSAKSVPRLPPHSLEPSEASSEDGSSVHSATLPSLHEILMQVQSDKAYHHGYTRYYESLFLPLRSQHIRLVEIGVADGRSMKAWQTYFTHAELFGIDSEHDQKQPKSLYQRGPNHPATWCSLYRGDQGDTSFLTSFLRDTGGRFNIVIDDGSHLPDHQRISFEHIWPAVVPGGMYIIEDVETSYWKSSASVYGYSLQGQPSIVEHMKTVADTINREFRHGKSTLPPVYDDVSSITFGQNIIILKKQSSSEQHCFFGRQYRFAERLP